MPGTGWDSREHCLWDIAWLNYFGPAFLERRGPALDRLGVRQEATANGGIIVWATHTPFVFDATARAMTDYRWKRPFFEELGPETILHERWRVQERGAVVPSFEEHRRATRIERSDSPWEA
jgi:hypothetical protein